MYGCESWTIKKAECQGTDAFFFYGRSLFIFFLPDSCQCLARTDAFELWCWRRLLRVPWTARRSNQSILKEISPECSLEGLMLKVKLQYFGHLMWRTDSLERPWCWKGLKAGGEGDNRGWRGWIASPTQWRWVWVNSRSWWRRGRPGVLQSMGSWRVRHNWVTELNWTEHGMWDLSSPTRDWIHTPCFGRRSLNHWLAREAQGQSFNCAPSTRPDTLSENLSL